MPARKAQAKDLGCFVTYTHSDDNRDRDEVIRQVEKRKQLADFVDLFPGGRSGTHIFQSACRSVQSSRGNGAVEVDVDEVVNDASECVYQITRRVRDKSEKVVEFEKSMTLAFNKGLGTIELRKLDDYDALRGLEERVREHFKANREMVPGQKIRNAIRDVILSIGGQNVRGKAGGLYFVPEEYRAPGTARMRQTMPVLDDLADLISELYGERGDLFVIPAPDQDYYRKIVAKHFQINARERSQELLGEALNRIRQGSGKRGLREDFYLRIAAETRRLGHALDQFDEMVGVERKEIEANLRDLEKAIVQLDDLRGKSS